MFQTVRFIFRVYIYTYIRLFSLTIFVECSDKTLTTDYTVVHRIYTYSAENAPPARSVRFYEIKESEARESISESEREEEGEKSIGG